MESSRGNFLLDSSLNSDISLGRYSIIGSQPFHILKGNKLELLEELRLMLNNYKVRKNTLPFCGGAVGYMAYDTGNNIPLRYYAFYNSAVIIDHLKQRMHLYSCGAPEKTSILAKKLAEDNFKRLSGIVSSAAARKSTLNKIVNKKIKLSSNFSKAQYLRAVRKAKEYIRKGDIYQINLSQQFSGRTDLSAMEIYRRLRKESPSYFSAFFDAGDFQIISSSPERFLKLDKAQVSTRPMKGTRPRCGSRARDNELRRQLLKSEKDKAELLMIVDLERNDLGRVCDYD